MLRRDCILAIFLAAAGVECALAEAKAVKLGIALPSYRHGVAWIAKDAGLFARQGLDVEIVTTKGSAPSVQMLLSGDLDFALAGGDAAVKADLAGGDVVILAGFINRSTYRLVVRPGIVAPADLKGRSLGIVRVGGPQDAATAYYLRKNGLVPGQDVTIRYLGVELGELELLRKGLVDGVMTDATLPVIREMGFHVLADMRDFDEFPYMMLLARRKSPRDGAPSAEAVLRTLCEAAVFYRDRKKESLAILTKRYQSDAASAEIQYRENISLFSFPPDPGLAGIRLALDLAKPAHPRAGERRAEEFLDLSVLDGLKASGYCGARGKKP